MTGVFLRVDSDAHIERRVFRRCGTQISDEQLQQNEKHFQENKISSSSAAATDIDVYWHVIRKSTSEDDGDVP